MVTTNTGYSNKLAHMYFAARSLGSGLWRPRDKTGRRLEPRLLCFLEPTARQGRAETGFDTQMARSTRHVGNTERIDSRF
jgi:hypothetical protein